MPAPQNPASNTLSNGAGNIPTIFAAFGATGDLMRRKVIPAIFHLHRHNELPAMFHIVGFSRRDWSDADFRSFIKEVIEKHEGKEVSAEILRPFLERFTFQQGTFEDPKSYDALKTAFNALDKEWGVCANKLFYLSVAPEHYDRILKHLSRSGLVEPCAPGEGWTHLIVEKPFGMDSKTARRIDTLLGTLFDETQVYRIDHYLAKEMLQNILAFRFSNNLFELAWGSELIESVHIKLLEKIGVEDRGEFYDPVGALRDVGQNHLLQMLALVAMDKPIDFDPGSIQKKRGEILRQLKPISQDDASRTTYRAQYEGYRNINKVDPKSQTETYFKIRAELDHPKWRGVPFVLESGKRMGEASKEILITFKHPAPCLCPKGQPHHKNEIIIRMEPREEILIEFWSKSLGFAFATEPRFFHYMLRESSVHVPYVEEYSKLLLDCVRGDQTLFISTEEVSAMWDFTDSVLNAWKKNAVPLNTYKPDTKDISKASKSLESQSGVASAAKKEIGIIGLGKMGSAMSRRLKGKGWAVHGYDPNESAIGFLNREGMHGTSSLRELVEGLSAPRTIWLMVPHAAVDEVLYGHEGIAKQLSKGDVVVDGGNTYFKDSITRAKKLKKFGVTFIDVGFSGGPSGAENGGCLMIGGDEKMFKKLEPLFADVAQSQGYRFFEGIGAGHFVKMVHNGIEYGMMQALAEGFAMMKKSKYKLDLTRVAEIYNQGSVIESRLVDWLRKAFVLRGEDLKGVSGSVGHTGEAAWTVQTAEEMKVAMKVIEESLKFRKKSAKNPDYTGKVLSALREQFGGHSIKK